MLTLPAMKHHSSGCAGGFVLRIPAMRAMELSDAVAWSRCLMATSWREWRTPSRPNEGQHMMAVMCVIPTHPLPEKDPQSARQPCSRSDAPQEKCDPCAQHGTREVTLAIVRPRVIWVGLLPIWLQYSSFAGWLGKCMSYTR